MPGATPATDPGAKVHLTGLALVVASVLALVVLIAAARADGRRTF